MSRFKKLIYGIFLLFSFNSYAQSYDLRLERDKFNNNPSKSVLKIAEKIASGACSGTQRTVEIDKYGRCLKLSFPDYKVTICDYQDKRDLFEVTMFVNIDGNRYILNVGDLGLDGNLNYYKIEPVRRIEERLVQKVYSQSLMDLTSLCKFD